MLQHDRNTEGIPIEVQACGRTIPRVQVRHGGNEGYYKISGRFFANRVCEDLCLDIVVSGRNVYRHCFEPAVAESKTTSPLVNYRIYET